MPMVSSELWVGSLERWVSVSLMLLDTVVQHVSASVIFPTHLLSHLGSPQLVQVYRKLS